MKTTFIPPVGANFRLVEYVPSEWLPDIVQAIWVFVRSKTAPGYLLRFDDWWQHDGLHFFWRAVPLPFFEKSISCIADIIKSLPGEFNVRAGICDQGMTWYLRYYVDSDNGVEGDCDITVPDDWAKEFEREVIPKLKGEWVKEPSATYYKRIIPEDGKQCRC